MKTSQIFSTTAILSGLMAFPASVWAQETSEPFRHGYGHNMMGHGGGWHGPLVMIVVLAIVVVLIVLLVRWLGGSWRGPQTSQHVQSGSRSLDILKERYARGEIDKEEYEERRNVLGD